MNPPLNALLQQQSALAEDLALQTPSSLQPAPPAGLSPQAQAQLQALPPLRQHWSLKQPVVFEGKGLHTGATARLEIRPWQTPGFWLQTHPQQAPLLLASEGVEATQLCTTVSGAMTIEHVLAALRGLGLSAALLVLEGPECPALDGSAWPWVAGLLNAGLIALPQPRRHYRLSAPWQWQSDKIQIRVAPAEALHISYSVDYPRSAGHFCQQLDYRWSPQSFVAEIAQARTFSFAQDIPLLQAAGFAQGGSLSNALLLQEDGQPLNPARFADEAIRHKILDLLGDLGLLQYPLQANMQIHGGGHSAHVTMIKNLRPLLYL